MSNAVKGARKSRRKLFLPPDAQVESPALKAMPAQFENAGQEELAAEGTGPASFNWIRKVSQVGDVAVFRAEEAGTGNLVTVELLSESAARDPEQVKLFYLEADAAARLQHPQIARFHTANRFALTHQRRISHLPGGETLRDLLSHCGWFDAKRALRVIAQVADTLAYAHQTGVLHLNLQPEHIWLDTADRVFITGFGIADDEQSEWARRLRTGRCMSPYLSPEQLNGQAGDRASDIFAIGVIFYELLTDRVPFDSIDLDHLRRQHKIKTPRPPRDFNHNLPPEFSEAVMELLNRDPEARVRSFRSADIFRVLLDSDRASELVQAASAPMTIDPMPLSEPDASTQSTALALRPAEELIQYQPTSAPVSLGSQQRSALHYRSVMAIVALVMLFWFVIYAIRLGLGN